MSNPFLNDKAMQQAADANAGVGIDEVKGGEVIWLLAPAGPL